MNSFVQDLDVALIYNLKPENIESNQCDEKNNFNNNGKKFLAEEVSQKKNVDVFAEWDSQETIDAVKNSLSVLHNVIPIEANENVFSNLLLHKPQIVFNVSECINGISREAQIPAMLDFLSIPYTGSEPLTLATCLDKSRTKEILSYYKIPTAQFCVIENLSQIDSIEISFPLFVKPLHEGSSKGIFNSSVVKNKKELVSVVEKILVEYNQPALVEKYLTGKEFTVALLGNGNDVKVLPIVEINFDSLPKNVNPIFSYEAKWIWDTKESPLDIFECPAKISSTLKNKIEKICLETFKVLRCRDWARIDIRLDEFETPNIIEINPLPGILPKVEDNSCFPKAARSAGISYDELLLTVLHLAAVRNNLT